MSEDLLSIRAAEVRAGRWKLTGAGELSLINDFLGYVADRGYSPRTVRAYAFDLLHFARWLAVRRHRPGRGRTPMCCCGTWRRTGPSAADGQHENVIPLARGSASGFAPATINRRHGRGLGLVHVPVDA